MSDKKYYWLRLHEDFFKRHDIKIVESMPNGKDYIIFYLKLLCESISHEGRLRFSNEIPYSIEMLSTITNTNVDIVKSAVDIFAQLKMIEVLDDGTLFLRQAEKLIGYETDWARKKREYREKQKLLVDNVSTNKDNVLTQKDNVRQEIEKEIEIDINKKEINKEKRFVCPTVEEVKNYCEERKNNIDAEYFVDFYTSKNWYIGKDKMKDWKAAVRTWEKRNKQKPKEEEVETYDSSNNTKLTNEEIEAFNKLRGNQ